MSWSPKPASPKPALTLIPAGALIPAAHPPTAHTHPTQPAAGQPRLAIAPAALGALRWSAGHSPNEFCFWGVLEAGASGLRLAEAVLARHQGFPAYSIPDMDWYADLIAERHATSGLEPWQLACWIHTHPAGLDRPSGVDRATFGRHFGAQRLAVMLIMTRDLRFYGELSACLPPLAGLPATRLTSPLAIEFEDACAQADTTQLQQLEQEYSQRVAALHPTPSRPGMDLPWWRMLEEEDPDGLLNSINIGQAEDEEDYLDMIPDEEADWPEAVDALLLDDRELLDYLTACCAEHDLERADELATMLDLETIAQDLGTPAMSVEDAALLRGRLRRLLAQHWPGKGA